MSTELHRILFVLLFAGFGSLSAYGFDQMTQPQQEKQAEIRDVENQLQRLSRGPSHDLVRLRLLCKLSSAYEQIKQPSMSQTLQVNIAQVAKRLRRDGVAKLPTSLISCTKKTHG